jgi:hypothetical protein
LIDVFRVGVSIAMSSNGPEVLGVLLRDLGRVHGAVDALKDNFAALKVVAGGALAAFAGAAALRGMWSMVDAGKELNRELNRTITLGGEFAREIGSIRATAIDVSRQVGTSTPSGNVALIRELGTMLSSAGDARAVLPQAARLAWTLQHFTGRDQAGALQDAVKVADLRGSIFSRGADGEDRVDPALLSREMNAMAAGIVSSGGMLKPRDYLNFFRQAGVPGRMMNIEAAYALASEAMTTMGSHRAGTATTSLYQQLVGGQLTRRTAEEMEAMGLLRPGEFRTERGGRIVVDRGATQRLQEQVGADPFQWILSTLVPQLEAQGRSGQDMLGTVFRLFGRQTTQRLVAEVATSGPQYARARSLFRNVEAPDDTFNRLMNTDLTTNITALQSAWKGLMEVITDAGTPAAISILTLMRNAVHDLTKWAAENPGAVQALTTIGAALGAFAIVAGGAAIISAIGVLGVLAGPAGLLGLAAGIAAIGAALPTIPAWVIRAGIGAAVGGAAGSVVPGLGTGAGAVAGGLAGALLTGPNATPRFTPPAPNGGQDFLEGWVSRGAPVTVTNGRDLSAGVFRQGGEQMSRPSFLGLPNPRLTAPTPALGGAQ